MNEAEMKWEAEKEKYGKLWDSFRLTHKEAIRKGWKRHMRHS